MALPWEMNWGAEGEQAAPPPKAEGKKPWLLDWAEKTFSKSPQKPQEAPVAASKPLGDGLTLDTVFEGLKQAESGGIHINAKTGGLTTSPAGAEGITQLMPKTAAKPGYGIEGVKDKSEKEYLRVGKEYLAAMHKKYGDWEMALAAYNAGPKSIDIAKGKAERFGGEWKDYLPKKEETIPYIDRVLGRGKKTSALTMPKDKFYEGTSKEQMLSNVKETAYDIASMTPVVGDVMSIVEGYEGFKEGDPLKMASGALGVVPFISAGVARKAVHGTLQPESLVKGFSREKADEAKGKYAVLGEGFYFSRKGGKTDWANEYAGYSKHGGGEHGGAVFPNEVTIKKPLFFSAEWATSVPPSYNKGGFKGLKQFTESQSELASFINKTNKPEYAQFLDTRSKDQFINEAIKTHLPEKDINKYYDELDVLYTTEKTQDGYQSAVESLNKRYNNEWKKTHPKEFAAAEKEADIRDKLRIVNADKDPKTFSKMLKEAGFDGVVDLPENQYMVIDPKNIISSVEAKYARTLGTNSKTKQDASITNLISYLEKEGKTEEANKLRGLVK